MAYPVSTKATLRHSHVVCTVWHHTTSPCPTSFRSHRTYLPRTLPEVTLEAENFHSVNVCRQHWSARSPLHCNCVHCEFLGQYICGLYQHETVQIIILCSNLLEYKNYAFALEKGKFPNKVTGLLCGRRVCQFAFFSCKDCQQLDSTITDVPLQVRGLDKSFYGYTKQSSNEQPIECEDPPS